MISSNLLSIKLTVKKQYLFFYTITQSKKKAFSQKLHSSSINIF